MCSTLRCHMCVLGTHYWGSAIINQTILRVFITKKKPNKPWYGRWLQWSIEIRAKHGWWNTCDRIYMQRWHCNASLSDKSAISAIRIQPQNEWISIETNENVRFCLSTVPLERLQLPHQLHCNSRKRRALFFFFQLLLFRFGWVFCFLSVICSALRIQLNHATYESYTYMYQGDVTEWRRQLHRFVRFVSVLRYIRSKTLLSHRNNYEFHYSIAKARQSRRKYN